MYQIRDTDAGLSLSLARDPHPRNPRIADDNLFQIVTWTDGLGDSHDWPSPSKFQATITPDMALILPLLKTKTAKGAVLVRSWSDEDRIAGYAFATHERLLLAFGADALSDGKRDETMEQAEYRCLGELQAYDDFVQGDVFRLEVVDRRGRSLEKRRDLYGEEYARHVAQTVFDQHLKSVSVRD